MIRTTMDRLTLQCEAIWNAVWEHPLSVRFESGRELKKTDEKAWWPWGESGWRQKLTEHQKIRSEDPTCLVSEELSSNRQEWLCWTNRLGRWISNAEETWFSVWGDPHWEQTRNRLGANQNPEITDENEANHRHNEKDSKR